MNQIKGVSNMEITASMLAQLLQDGTLDIGCTILTLDADLDFVRRNGTMVSEDLKAVLRGIKQVDVKIKPHNEPKFEHPYTAEEVESMRANMASYGPLPYLKEELDKNLEDLTCMQDSIAKRLAKRHMLYGLGIYTKEQVDEICESNTDWKVPAKWEEDKPSIAEKRALAGTPKLNVDTI
jgi:hypothetical protein